MQAAGEEWSREGALGNDTQDDVRMLTQSAEKERPTA